MTHQYLCTSLLALPILLFSHSCSQPVDYENRPVVLPKDPPKKDYFVSKEKLITTFGTDHDVNATSYPKVPLVFNYNGSLMQNTRHNRDQAKAVSDAMRSTPLTGKHFSFLIKGSDITLNHKESLLNLLSASGARLRNLEVTSSDSNGNTLLENTIEDRAKKNKTTVIMRELP